MKCELTEQEIKVLNRTSKQKWISIKDYIPSTFITDKSKGDYAGRYLCIVEHKVLDGNHKYKNDIFYPKKEFSKAMYRTIEMCYWNNLALQFQDHTSAWVKVTHWSPIPNMPKHNIIVINRNEMIDKISSLELELVTHEYELNNTTIEGMWNTVKELALHLVSFDTTVYLSTEIDKNNLENCMWCIKIENNFDK